MSGGGFLRADGDDVLIRIKAVPGAARDEIAGCVGDRLKVRVSAPPQGGRANRAVCGVVARALGLKPRRVCLERGGGAPEKTLRVSGAQVDQVRRRLTPGSA